jgi:hypothetical protein
MDHLLGPNSEWKEEPEEEEPTGIAKWFPFPWPGKGHKDRQHGSARELPQVRPAGDVEGEDGVCTVSSGPAHLDSLLTLLKDCFNWEYGDFSPASEQGSLGCSS